jgi:hypothetical protein
LAGGHRPFPQLAALFEPGVDPDAPDTRDTRFEFGLDCLLDGIAARMSALAQDSPGA